MPKVKFFLLPLPFVPSFRAVTAGATDDVTGPNGHSYVARISGFWVVASGRRVPILWNKVSAFGQSALVCSFERMPVDAGSSSFWGRHEFLIRRLHSLTGLVPVGAYMVVHLLTNATVLDSPNKFQQQVYLIHSLGAVLPVVEWTFIFLPIIFHGVVGLFITAEMLPNNAAYNYTSNFRYTMQRVTGLIAFAFIAWHVFHMHGWIHAEWWRERVLGPLGGGYFYPYNAASSARQALNNPLAVVLYGVGVLACVYHLANGIWTAGITWGVWTTPQAMRRAVVGCAVFGVVLAAVSMGALVGMATMDVSRAKEAEERMLRHMEASGQVTEEQVKEKSYPPKRQDAALAEPNARRE
jgi:succinate dehydrogenase / fumarate reductase cytochrome b subunit